jgi:SAM-dependent methyltransferase
MKKSLADFFFKKAVNTKHKLKKIFFRKVCPVCGNTDFHYVLYNNHRACWRTEVVEDLKRYLKRKDDPTTLFLSIYDIRICGNCGYGRYEKYIDDDLLKEFYINKYFKSKGLTKIINYDYRTCIRAGGQYRFVEEYLKGLGNFRMLEIGAADANSTQLIREKIKGVIAHAVEPGEGWKNYYQERDIELISESFPFGVNRGYDYIHCSHWLEHVADLAETIKCLKMHLNKRGFVFIEVPNCCREYWLFTNYEPEGHIHFFSLPSLAKLFQKYGFKLNKIGTYGMRHPERALFWMNRKKLDNSVIEKGNRSVKHCLLRKDGEYIRALFQLYDE